MRTTILIVLNVFLLLMSTGTSDTVSLARGDEQEDRYLSPIEYPFYQIYTQTLDGTPELISTGRGRTTCSYFHPDGETILFASSHLDPRL